MKLMDTTYFTLIISLFFSLNSFSQMEQKVVGTWAFSGNNVYVYDFAGSGKVSATTCQNDATPVIITDGWRITGDSLFHLKEKKKSTYIEHSYKIVELTNSKMVLNYPSTDFVLVFYKIEPNKKKNVKLSENVLINTSFNVIPIMDTLICKISFGENGACRLHRKVAVDEGIQSELKWKILNREDNVFLMINDFEIFVLNNINTTNSELEFISYGYYRATSGVESIKLVKEMD